MKKYVKVLTFLLSGSYLVDINSSFAGDRDPHPGGVVRYEGRASGGIIRHQGPAGDEINFDLAVQIPQSSTGLVSAETLGFSGTQISHDRDGSAYSVSVFRTPEGAEIGIAVPEERENSAAFVGSQNLRKAASEGTIPGDTRTQKERDADTDFVWGYRNLAELKERLNDFATGSLENDLNKLAKALRKIKPNENALMDQALAAAPALIRKIKTEGESIREGLGRDLVAVLELLRILDEHCQTYINGRINLTPTVKLRDVLLPEDAKIKVTVERTNTTEIRDAFLQVERTLNFLKKKDCDKVLENIRYFLQTAQELKDSRSEHGRNIYGLSERFFEDAGTIIGLINTNWKSPEEATFESFRIGIINLNMLMEHITDYAASAKKIADGTYAHLLAAPEAVAAIEDGSAGSSSAVALRQKAAAGGSSALTVGGETPTEAIARLRREKRYAEAGLRNKGLADFRAKILSIQDYIDGRK